jgi:hypothetical protein
MAMIELTLELFPNAVDCASDARIWIDLELVHGGLSSESEVPLWPAGAHRWRGVFVVDDSRDLEFGYRVGLFAAPDTEWSLRFQYHVKAQSCSATAIGSRAPSVGW